MVAVVVNVCFFDVEALYSFSKALLDTNGRETKTIVNGVWAIKYETKRNITNFISQVEIITDK